MKQAFIFDMDGTLLDSKSLAQQTYPEVLRRLKEQKVVGDIEWTEDQINHVIGMTTEDLFTYLLPEASEDQIQLTMRILEEGEDEFFERTTTLYSGVIETLQKLKENGYELYVASNGGATYVPMAAETHNITHLFTNLYCAGLHKTANKVDLVKLLLQENNLDKAVMVGDRYSDIEAGKQNHLTTVGCLYGFGSEKELLNADYLINSLTEIIQLAEEILVKEREECPKC